MLVYTKLEELVQDLAQMPENSEPVVSCYIDLNSSIHWSRTLANRMRELKATYEQDTWEVVEKAFHKIWDFMETGLEQGKTGIAIFARAGEEPYLRSLQFESEVPDWISVDTTPNIYHLIELKDTMHRYVVLISTKESAKIYEVNLGSVTHETWLNRPELRQRVGREWTRQHFRAHAEEKHRGFVRKQIEIVEKLMAAEGYTHLILAGDERLTSEIRKELPKNLENKLINRLSLSPHDLYDVVISETLEAFIEHEQQESQDTVELLFDTFHKHGLAVLGVEDSVLALERGQADTLVISSTYEFPSLWVCNDCGSAHLRDQAPDSCHSCASEDLRERSTRDELTRLAVLSNAKVETVKSQDLLEKSGGVGCLLRYGPVVHFDTDDSSLSSRMRKVALPETKNDGVDHSDPRDSQPCMDTLISEWENEGGSPHPDTH